MPCGPALGHEFIEVRRPDLVWHQISKAVSVIEGIDPVSFLPGPVSPCLDLTSAFRVSALARQ
jgi:hypothetical protein